MRTIVISSFHPLISRNILSTTILDRLLASGKVRIVIVCPKRSALFLEELYGNKTIVVGVEMVLGKKDLFMRRLSLLTLRTRTLGLKRQTEMHKHGVLISRFCTNRFGQWFIRAINFYITPKGTFDHVFETYAPHVVLSTDIQNEFDVRLYADARAHNVCVIGMVRSWDNLTAKGFVRFVPDRLLVHNAIIKQEAIELHHFPEEIVDIVGIPHYERYTSRLRSPKDVFFKRIGADVHKKLVLYVPTGDRYIKNNTVDLEILNMLGDIIEHYSMQILVRMPPADTVTALANYDKKNVFFDQINKKKFYRRKFVEISPDDDAHLADILYWSDLVVSGGSTMCVDAAVFDKPVVVTGFDGLQKKEYLESVRRYYTGEYSHLDAVFASGGVSLALSPEEFKTHVKMYLSNPSLHSENRTSLVAAQGIARTSESAQKIADILLAHLLGS